MKNAVVKLLVLSLFLFTSVSPYARASEMSREARATQFSYLMYKAYQNSPDRLFELSLEGKENISFAKKEFKKSGWKTLPLASMDENKIRISAGNEIITLELVNLDRKLFRINGHEFHFDPSRSLREQASKIQQLLANSHFFPSLIPEAQAEGAILGIIGLVTIVVVIGGIVSVADYFLDFGDHSELEKLNGAIDACEQSKTKLDMLLKGIKEKVPTTELEDFMKIIRTFNVYENHDRWVKHVEKLEKTYKADADTLPGQIAEAEKKIKQKDAEMASLRKDISREENGCKASELDQKAWEKCTSRIKALEKTSAHEDALLINLKFNLSSLRESWKNKQSLHSALENLRREEENPDLVNKQKVVAKAKILQNCQSELMKKTENFTSVYNQRTGTNLKVVSSPDHKTIDLEKPASAQGQ